MHWVCASDTAAQETPEVDDFSAGINVSILSGACLYIRANIERGCDQKGTTSVLYSVRRKVLRGGRRSRSLSDHSHAVLLLKNFHEGPSSNPPEHPAHLLSCRTRNVPSSRCITRVLVYLFCSCCRPD